MRRVLGILLILCLAIFVGTSNADVTVHGPKQYDRTDGAPDVYSDDFSAIVHEGRIVVTNGRWDGTNRIEDPILGSGRVSVNGEEIFSPNDFNQNVYTLEAPLTLAETNTVEIELTSKPGSYITVEIFIVNNAPVADPQSLSTDEDIDLPITLTGSDADGEALTFEVVQPPAHGTLSGTAPDLTYSPNADYNGSDAFTFKADDSIEESEPAEITITIIPVNDAPIAVDDTVITDEDTPVVTSNVLANDSDVDGDTLTVSDFTTSSNGTVESHGDGTFTYTPDLNFNGTDSFTYTVSDGNGGTDTAVVTITVNPVNDPPIANDDAVATDEDTALPITLTGSDVDGDTLTHEVTQDPDHGTLSGIGPDLTYTPDANYNGPDTFSFLVNDGTIDSVAATVTITIAPVNDPPTLSNVSKIEEEDVTINFSGTDFSDVFVDLDGDPLQQILIASLPANGTLNLNGTAIALNAEIAAADLDALAFVPDNNWHGDTSFDWNGFDGEAYADTNAAVNITITAVNDVPTISHIADQTTNEDTPTSAINFTIGDEDTPLDSLTISGSSSDQVLVPDDAIVFGGSGADRTVTLTPADNRSGATTITINVSDGTDQAIHTFNFTVTAVADMPILTVVPTASGYEGAPVPLTIDPPALVDVDGSETLSDITISGVPSDMPLSAGQDNGDGSWTLTADQLPGLTITPPVSDVRYFTLTVSVTAIEGENNDQATATATIDVTVVFVSNDIPVTNGAAMWDEGYARLTWDIVEGLRYQIYRGNSPSDISELAETDVPPFVDTTSHYYFTYYYQLATIKDFTVPVTGEVVHRIGPRSDIITLEALPAARAPIDDAQIAPDGTYTVVAGEMPSYTITGTYEVMSGNVTVTATSGDLVVTGTGSNGTFSIELPGPGQWHITVEEVDGWMYASMELLVLLDNEPPVLVIDGPDVRTTEDDFILLTGTATDGGSGLASVAVFSDRYLDQPFGAIVGAIGEFSCEVPVRVGENQLTIIACDNVENQTQQSVKVTLQISALPTITINTPTNGSSVTEERITVSGVVRSSLPPEQIRVVLGSHIQFPTGTGGEYSFSFEDVRLVEGPNTLTVTAETIHGNVSAQTTVSYLVEAPEEEAVPPVIEIQSTGPEVFLTEDLIIVSGVAASGLGIQSVTVNGQELEVIGSGTDVSFQGQLQFPTGQNELEIVVEVTDGTGDTSSVSYVVRYDATAPVIQLTSPGLQMAPEVNSVTETPYAITGTVIEKNLAGLSMNGQTIGVLPVADDTYSFEADVALVRGQERSLTIEAWDMAGNRTSADLIMYLDASLDIEVISPRDGAELMAGGATLDVAVTVRVPGMAEDDVVSGSIDDGATTTLARTGSTANATLGMAATDGEHKLVVEVASAAGTVLARRTTRFSIINTANIPLAVERQEPANNEQGVEPNAFIAFYFNKPIDSQQLQIQVFETAHGLIYDTAEKGADITQLSEVELVEVHRDREPVPGGISHFPENTMAAFYPERDFAYGGTVYVNVLYNGEDLSDSTLHIRPLPTFIQGFVADQFMQPIEGIEVEIPELGKRAVTDINGNYGFGFGEPASETIPGGRYLAVINPNLKNWGFGTVERWMNVEVGRLNSVGVTPIPVLNPEEPFRHIVSGQGEVLLAGGELTLTLTDASLTFPDGRDHGDVHVQFMSLEQLPYPCLASAMPHWVFAVQPMGIEVTGNVQMTFDMPPLYGSHEYVSEIGDRVVLVGIDPDALQIVPVGVGYVDVDNKQVVSEGNVTLERLDFLGYALVDTEEQAVLERFVNGEISLNQMIGELETQQ